MCFCYVLDTCWALDKGSGDTQYSRQVFCMDKQESKLRGQRKKQNKNKAKQTKTNAVVPLNEFGNRAGDL